MSKKDKFNLRPPTLIEILQSILRQYPPDGQILKELIQNADDAGATEIKFLLDDTQYGTNPSKFHHPGLVEFQGPALYAYNNGKFEDKDWESIGLINRSLKESDPIAVGRFGLGFKSVFHMTDLPCLIADDTIGFIDPHEKYFRTPNGDRRSTYLWDLSEDRGCVVNLADQFQPFQLGLFGLDSNVLRNGNYESQTLFRFPLRRKPSELSPTIFTNDDVLELFRSLEKEAFSILLFLNSLEKIEVYQRQNGAKETILLSIRLENQCLTEVRQKRRQYKSILRNEPCSEGSVTFLTVIEKECFRDGMPKPKETQCWAVSLCHEDKKESEPVELIMDKLKVKPVAGSALLLYAQREGLMPQPFVGDASSGNIFCFLPLPLEIDSPTGLKVHVNAYFALEQNRRHLKWPSADQDPKRVSEEGSRWNIHLVENTIPNSMIKLIMHLIEISEDKVETNETVMKAIRYCQRCDVRYFIRLVEAVIPNSNKLKTNWKRIEKSFFERISENKIFFYSQPQLETIWLNAFSSDAVFAKLQDFERNSILYDTLAKYLLKGCRKRLVYTSEYILNSLDKYCRRPNIIEPSSLCSYVKTTSGHKTTDEEKYAIIDYLCDYETSEISKHSIGLELIPLNDGRWTQIRQRSGTSIIYIPNGQHSSSLLPNLARVFLLEDLNHKRKQFFDMLARRGDLNIKFLDALGVISLLDAVPGIISSASNHLVRNSNQQTITYDWLVQLWNYARWYGVEQELCQKATRLYLMPTDRNAEKLVKLGSGKTLVINSSDEMENMYRAFDAQVLTGISWDINCEIMILEGYIVDGRESSALMNVVKAQIRLCGERKVIKMCEIMTENDKRIFQRYLYDDQYSWSRSKSDSDIVKRLPIFYTLPNSGSKRSESAMNVKVGARRFSTKLTLSEAVLDLRTETEYYLGEMFGVELLTEEDLILNYVVPQMLRNLGSNESIMQQIFLEYSYLFTYGEVSKHMKAVRFIRSKSGGLFSAEQLYDDADPLIKELFATESCFPAGIFGPSEYRHFLQKLGLRQLKDITVKDLIPVARRLQNSGSNASPTTSKAFLQVLERLAISGQDLNPFRNFKCIKSINNSTATSTDSKCLQGSFFKPNEILSKEFASLVGFVKPLIDTEGLDQLARVFGWNKDPPIQDVLRQLQLLVERFQKDVKSAQFVRDTRRTCEDIYGFLEECLSKKTDSKDLISALSTSPCIFCENCFLEPTRCASESVLSAECLPLLSSIPATWASCYPRLFECLGVKQTFNVDDYLWALEQLHDEQLHDLSSSEQDSRDRPTILKKSLKIINCIDTNEPMDSSRSVYIPNGDGTLCNAKELWFSSGIETSCAKGNQCHPLIPPTLAAYLGARSQKQVILNSHLVALEGLPFGQSEELVNRIQRILTGYPMDQNILKEMLQNADDAGATKLHFIIDPRLLPDDKIFDEHWKPLQGPALCVYNDRPFTSEDIAGIQSLGHGSKSDDSSKIGKFGVGFNCVYHLTDAPTLLCQVKGQGKRLCIFDPTLQFVGFATDIRPGYMFTDLESLKVDYPDVFLGFLEKEYGAEDGTMFRLALRQKASRISTEIVTVQGLRDLFKKIEDELHECLIFLKNVREISLREVDKRTNAIKEIYTVKASVKEEGRKCQEKIVKKCQSIAAWIKDTKSLALDLKSVAPIQVIYDLVTEDSNHLRCEWRIAERVGFSLTDSNETQLPNLLKNREIGSIPYGGLAVQLEFDRRKKKKETKVKQRPKLNDNGRIFIQLPLDVSTELPIQLNGYFALEYENRRNIWKETAGGDKTEWNYFLMRSVVAPAYCQLLSTMRPHTESLTDMDSIHSEVGKYQSLFPDCKSVQSKEKPKSYSEEMIIAVYRNIAKNNMELFPVYRNDMKQVEWIGINGNGLQLAYFDHLQSQLSQPFSIASFSSKKTPAEPLKHEIMRKILVRSGMHLIITPSSHIHKNMKLAEVTVNSTTAASVFAFFKNDPNSKRKRRLSETPFENISGLAVAIQYVLSKDNEEVASQFWTCLIDAPFLLTEDDMLQVFKSDGLKYFTRFSKLFPPCSDQFVKYEIAEVIQSNIRKVACELDPSKSTEAEDTRQKLTKSFRLEDFSTMLPKLIPMELFGNNVVRSMNELNEIVNKHCWTNVSIQTSPNFDVLKGNRSDLSVWWLTETWKFISSELLCCSESDREKIGQKLNVLKDWSLLPVKCANDEKLLPIGNSDAVFVYSEMQSRVKEDILSVLKKIRVPEPYNKILFDSGNRSRLMECLFHTKQDATVAVVNALLAGDYAAAVSRLQDKEKACLLQFLLQNLHQWKDEHNQTYLRDLLLLPIYQSYSGQRVAGHHFQTFIVPKDVPKAGFDLWSNELSSTNGTVFLREIDQSVSKMLLFLGCHELDILSAYRRFIFSGFHLLRDEDIVDHMTFIKDTVMLEIERSNKMKKGIFKQNEIDKFLSDLKTLKFLRRPISRELVCASVLFDSSNPIFWSFEDPDNLITYKRGSYDILEWRNFLISYCDLISDVSLERFLEYARSLPRTASDSVSDKFQVLIDHLGGMEADELRKYSAEEEALFNQLTTVKFVPLGLVSDCEAVLCRQHGCERSSVSSFVCFKESILFKHRQLAWSNSAILPETMDSMSDEVLQILGVKLVPTVSDVMGHLQKICESETLNGGIDDDDSSLKQTLENVLEAIYEFFTEESKKSGNFVPMRDPFPCIAVNNEDRCMLVEPIYVAMHLETEIKPYLYKLPHSLMKFSELLISWGVVESPDFSKYAMVLSEIHRSVFDECLSSKEDIDCCKAALNGLFNVLIKVPANDPTYFKGIDSLYLLGEDMKMHESSDLIVCDDSAIAERLQSLQLNYMARKQSLGLNKTNDAAAKLLQKLPSSLRPRFLTEVVTETLLADLEVNSEFRTAVALQNRLRGKWFKQGLFRLIKAALADSDDGQNLSDGQIWQFVTKVNDIEIKCLKRVATSLECDGKKVKGSERDFNYFVDGTVVYLSEVLSGTDQQGELRVTLSDVIGRMCGGYLSSKLHVVSNILDGDEIKIPQRLDNLKIRECDAYRDCFIPAEGELVPPVMHCLMKQEDWQDFQIGKLVAYEINDLIDSSENIRDEAEYVFARVVGRVEYRNQSVFRKFRINVGRDVEILVFGQYLYKFYEPELLNDLPESIDFSSVDMCYDTKEDFMNELLQPIGDSIQMMITHAFCVCLREQENEQEQEQQEQDGGQDEDEHYRNEEQYEDQEQDEENYEKNKRKVIKRFYLGWHPELNTSTYADHCTNVQSCIQQIYLQNQEYFIFYDERALKYGTQLLRFNQTSEPLDHEEASVSAEGNQLSADAVSHSDQSNWSMERVSIPPCPREARRFIRQAARDLEASANDRDGLYPSLEWSCYKCHQAAEKALKALQFLESGEQQYIHTLFSLCGGRVKEPLRNLVKELERKLPNHVTMRYPCYRRPNSIPHELFSEETALEVADLTKRIVEMAQNEIDSEASA